MKQRSVIRWMVFPVAFDCVSRSSVGVDVPSDPHHAIQNSTQVNMQKDSCIIKKIKHPLGFRLPKANIYHGIQRLIRRIKTASRLFVYKNEIMEEEDEDEGEMNIGYPTDVKHLTHIGWDGSTTVSKTGKEWDNPTRSEIISFPSISLKEFEVAMAQQATAAAVDNNI